LASPRAACLAVRQEALAAHRSLPPPRFSVHLDWYFAKILGRIIAEVESGVGIQVSPVIYQVSDLANRRTEFVEEARQGLARLRDKDGTSLVMLPESRLEHLERFRSHLSLYLVVEHGARTGEHLGVIGLGVNAWIRSLSVEDLVEFSNELGEALAAAAADDSTAVLDDVVSAWRTTARQLEDPLRRRVLLAAFDEADYVDAERPSNPGEGEADASV
jgi:hypothetical protein